MSLITLLRAELGKAQRKAAVLQNAIDALQATDTDAPATKRRGPKPGAKRGRKAGKTAKTVPPSGSMTLAEALKHTGLHQTTLSKLKREKVITGEFGRYDRESLDLYLESKK